MGGKEVYMITEEYELPLSLPDLIPLKVKVPKIKLSKYFQTKHNENTHLGSGVVKIGGTEFISKRPRRNQEINYTQP